MNVSLGFGLIPWYKA